MIRYETPAPVRKLVPENWLNRAKERTEKLIAKKKYAESSAIWSDVKPVFMELQHNKCLFCERQFEGPDYGRIEHDLEHYRPKNHYYWLAYDVENYGAACKVCNSTLKSNHFPIENQRGKAAQKIRAMNKSERPLLCYPLGRLDTDPADLVTFEGTIAVPVGKWGYKRARGEEIIRFFRLNDRDTLHMERAQMITLMGYALRELGAGIDVASNQEVVDSLTSPVARHTACSRAFLRSWHDDEAAATAVFVECRNLVSGQP